MRQDSITIQLQLAGLKVLQVKEWRSRIEVVVCYEAGEAACPGCGHSTWQVHQWRLQRKRDAKVWGKLVWLLLWKRRFRCRVCGKVFTEPDPVCGRYRRTTKRLRNHLAYQAEEATVRAVSRWQGVSEGLVQRSWLEEHSMVRAPSSPHVFLGLDGFCARRPNRMWTGMWNLESSSPVAITPGERQRDVQVMLEHYASRETVRAVVIDLAEAYRQAVQMALPEAAIVADKFHVIALAGRALREVHGGRRQRGNLAWLMQRGAERLQNEERQRLVEALADAPALAKAWALKEGLRSLYRSRGAREAATALTNWLRNAEESGLQPFRRMAATLGRWRLEVLNYWHYPLTNAIVEGKHNRVKVLKRRAYGYRNDRTFMLRILNCIHTD